MSCIFPKSFTSLMGMEFWEFDDEKLYMHWLNILYIISYYKLK